jgi:hypothetical protein
MSVELYDNYPDAAIISASYKNLGESGLTIESGGFQPFSSGCVSRPTQRINLMITGHFRELPLPGELDYVIKIDEDFQPGKLDGRST